MFFFIYGALIRTYLIDWLTSPALNTQTEGHSLEIPQALVCKDEKRKEDRVR